MSISAVKGGGEREEYPPRPPQLNKFFLKFSSNTLNSRDNPSTPRSDQHVTSPCNSYKLSCKQFMRTEKLISKRVLFWK